MKLERFALVSLWTLPWWRRMVLALGGLLLLWGLGWLAVPPLLKWQLETRLSEQLGRQVLLGRVDFKPWSLALTLHDLTMARATGPDRAKTAPAQLSIKRLYMNAELASLLHWAPVLDALEVESPRLALTHTGDGHYDVDDVLARLTSRLQSADSSPLGFALYNLALTDGAVVFTDQPLNKVHRLSQLQLGLPFLSSLDSKRQVLVQPRLAFDLNGSRFDSSAATTPFADTHKTDAQLRVNHLDLAPYLPYLPASLPVRLRSAVLDADLKLAFEQTAQTAITLSGQVTLSGVRLTAPQQSGKTAAPAELLAFDQLSVPLKAVRPLVHEVQLGHVELTRPHLMVQRDRAGALNWLTAFETVNTSQDASKTIADKAMDTRAKGKNIAQPGATKTAAGWKLGVDQITLKGGDIQWLDEALATPVQLRLEALEVQARSLAWPFTQPMPLEGSARLATSTLNFKGAVSDQAAEITARLADWPLTLAAPYVAEWLQPRVDGLVSAELGLNWAAAQLGQAAQLRLQAPSLRVQALALTTAPKQVPVSIPQLQLADLALDLRQQSAILGRLQLGQAKVALTRSADGRWMFQDWLKTAPAPEVPARSGAEATQPNWTLALKELQLTGGALSLADQAAAQPVNLDVSGLALQVKDFAFPNTKPFASTLSAQLRHRHTEPGQLVWHGSSSLSPLTLTGELNAQRLPLHALAPYFSDVLNVSLRRVDTSFQGRLQLAQQAGGLAWRVTGDAALEELRVLTLAQEAAARGPEDLLDWKSLRLRGLDVAMAPGVATRVDVQGTVLSDFYARLILNEAGRLNLQDVVKPSASQAPPAAQASALAPVIRFGPISLLGGHVNFTDRFIQPNYSADLTELAGKLSAFSSRQPGAEIELADLELRGRAEGSATLAVLGKINPLVQPLALDIKGQVRDLELAPLSTYSARYAGYGIERGKLSMDVSYQVKPDGQLSANNNLILNQLKFGDKVADSPANLPVKLAVALLADRQGVIDINLPVSGSLNDPEFRLFPIVLRVLGNLIVKAVTAPFSLLANVLGGGGDELGMVGFEPGSAALAPSAKAGLDKVAQALRERPALKMTVVGMASLEFEREAYKRSQLQALVQAEKRRRDVAGNADQAATAVTVSAQEYPELLKTIYRRGAFPKPRNLIGLTKDIPVPDMEALLLAHLDASESAMQALAVRRGVAVRDYLSSQKLPTERLFLGAAKAVPPEAKWTPRAQLSLATD